MQKESESRAMLTELETRTYFKSFFSQSEKTMLGSSHLTNLKPLSMSPGEVSVVSPESGLQLCFSTLIASGAWQAWVLQSKEIFSLITA